MIRPRGDWSINLVLPTLIVGSFLIMGGLLLFSNQRNAVNRPVTPELESFAVNELLPKDLVVTNEQNQQLRLDEILSKPTLVTLWTSTCNHCLPALTSQQAYSKRFPNISVITINFREDPTLSKEFLLKNNIDLPLYFDRNGLLFNELAGTIPGSYYIENGMIKYFFPGKITDDLLEKLFNPAS